MFRRLLPLLLFLPAIVCVWAWNCSFDYIEDFGFQYRPTVHGLYSIRTFGTKHRSGTLILFNEDLVPNNATQAIWLEDQINRSENPFLHWHRFGEGELRAPPMAQRPFWGWSAFHTHRSSETNTRTTLTSSALQFPYWTVFLFTLLPPIGYAWRRMRCKRLAARAGFPLGPSVKKEPS